MLLHKVCHPQNVTLQQWPVPVTLHDKQQYLIVHAILITLKQIVEEEKSCKVLQETAGIKIYIQNWTMQFLNSSSNVKTVDAVQLSWNKNTINDNNCHTANGDEIHSVQFC